MFDVSFSEDPSLPTRLSPMCSCTVHVAYTPPASFGRLSTSGTSSLKLMSGLKKKESVVRAGAGTAGRRTLCGVEWYSSLLKRWRICPTCRTDAKRKSESRKLRSTHTHMYVSAKESQTITP